MFLTAVLFLAALSISGVSAFYSITGLTAIFPGAFWPVIILGVVLELGKLAGVGFLHRHWCDAAFLIKTYLVIAILTLMLLNSVGIFGLLSKAHIAQEVSNAGQASTIQIVQEKIASEKSTIADYNTQIGNIDQAINKLTQTGRAGQAVATINSQRKARDKLSQDKMAHQSTLDGLNQQEVEKDNANKLLESDFGPLQYLADFVYGKADGQQLESTVRWIITVIVAVTDPLAIILLVSASFSLTARRKPLTSAGGEDMMLIHDEFFKE